MKIHRRFLLKKMAMLPPDPIYIFKGEMLSISCVQFQITEQVQRIYAGTQSGNVHIWNLKSKREVGNLKAGDDVCLSIWPSTEDDFLITHTKAGDISFWTETESKWTLKTVIKTEFFGFCKCQVFGSELFVPLKNLECEVISVKRQERLGKVKVECGGGEIMAFKVCVVGGVRVVLVGYEGHKLGVWELEGGGRRRSCLVLDDCPMAVDYEEVSGRGCCGGVSDKIVVFSLGEGLEVKEERSVRVRNAGVASLRIRGDGRLVGVGCWDGKVRLYSWKTLALLAVLDSHSSTVQDVSFSRKYKEGSKLKYLLAAGSQDSTISLWDLYN